MSTNVSYCKSCRARIVWTKTTNGKKMPVDEQFSDVGRFVLDWSTEPPTAVWAKKTYRGVGDAVDLERYEPHWTTCPDSAKFRKRPAILPKWWSPHNSE